MAAPTMAANTVSSLNYSWNMQVYFPMDELNGLSLNGLSEEVLAAAAMKMPFGRFKDTRLIDLPEPYVVWFKGQGFPSGLLGRRLALMYEIKANGLEKLIRPMLENA